MSAMVWLIDWLLDCVIKSKTKISHHQNNRNIVEKGKIDTIIDWLIDRLAVRTNLNRNYEELFWLCFMKYLHVHTQWVPLVEQELLNPSGAPEFTPGC
jgi:hypothetical protein